METYAGNRWDSLRGKRNRNENSLGKCWQDGEKDNQAVHWLHRRYKTEMCKEKSSFSEMSSIIILPIDSLL
jgi:hypothetical protein